MTRVVVVTTNPSLVIGLSVLDEDWEIDSVTDLDAVPTQVDVLVLDGHVPPAGNDVPTVSIVTADAPSPWGSDEPRPVVVRRPYALNQLARAIRRVLDDDGGAGVHDPEVEREEPSEQVWTASADATDHTSLRRRGLRALWPPTGRAGRTGDAARVEDPESDRDPTVASGRPPADDREVHPEEERPEEERAEEVQTDPPEVPRREADAEPADTTAARREPDPTTTPPDDQDSADLGVPTVPAEAPVTSGPVHRRAASPVADVHEAGEATGGPDDVLRRLRPTRLRRGRGDRPGRTLRERLGRTLIGASELEELVDELPVLADLSRVGTLIVDEVHEALGVDTVALWRQRTDTTWQVLAERGLTVTERRMRVPADQPLFHEVAATGGGVLIDPIDVVPEAVAGIGGAHTRTFAAAGLRAGPGLYGILAIGRDVPLTDADLDALLLSAQEAVPALAVADLLLRLRRATGAGADEPDLSARSHPQGE